MLILKNILLIFNEFSVVMEWQNRVIYNEIEFYVKCCIKTTVSDTVSFRAIYTKVLSVLLENIFDKIHFK